MKVAVVGHVEWVDFVQVERTPVPGEIVHAQEFWAEPAGGGADAAVELVRLAGAATLFTALGDDEHGRRAPTRLAALGVSVESVTRPEPQRRALTFLQADGERTITILGPKLVPRRSDPLPWEELEGVDAVYFTGGDEDALRAARAARVLVATARELPTLAAAGVFLDAVVSSALDAAEHYEPGDLDPPPGLAVWTRGAEGGSYDAGQGRQNYPPVAPPGPVADFYGSGDCFAAGLTYALAQGLEAREALVFAAERGALAVTRRGAFGGA